MPAPQELCGAGDSDAVRQLADGVCGAALQPHLHLELAWLAAAHEARLAAHAAAGGGLSMEEVLAMLGMNEEVGCGGWVWVRVCVWVG